MWVSQIVVYFAKKEKLFNYRPNDDSDSRKLLFSLEVVVLHDCLQVLPKNCLHYAFCLVFFHLTDASRSFKCFLKCQKSRWKSVVVLIENESSESPLGVLRKVHHWKFHSKLGCWCHIKLQGWKWVTEHHRHSHRFEYICFLNPFEIFYYPKVDI